MQYVLGNMLNGGGGLNADGLALDLQFAADKTMTARKGPTPVFTRGSTGTFVGSNGLIQSAAINTPRFDHASAGVCKGLLIEESRTNSQRYSDDFSLWSVTTTGGSSVTSNQTTAPDGSSNADLLAETATTGIHVISDQSISITSGTTYTISVFAKKGNGATAPDFIQLCGRGDTFGTTQFATFNISNGTVHASSSGTASIQNFGNGWYRCVFVVAATTTLTSSGMVIAFVGSTPGVRQPVYSGLATSNIFIWGAQLEAGSFATSSIPTVASSVVRSADVCSITGANFTSFYNPVEGSLAASIIFNAPVANAVSQALVDINDTTTANRLRMTRANSTGLPGLNNTSNSTQNVSIAGSVALQPLTTQKYSSGFKLDDYAFYVNNAQIGTDNLGAMPISVTTFTIGEASAGFSPRLHLNGTLAAIRYYRKRLPNAKLQALTV